jgi:hypothetical protein
MDIISIFNYENNNYRELRYDSYSINESWLKKMNIYEHPEIFGTVNEETWTIDVETGKFSPDNFCKDIDDCFGNIIKLFNAGTVYQEIEKKLLIEQLTGLANFYKNLYTKSGQFESSNYIEWLSPTIANFALLNHIYKADIKNKYMCFGTGKVLHQVIPNYIISDVRDNDEKYEIFIFERCDDDFGCPSGKMIYDYLIDKIHVSKISNIKIYHIKNLIEILSIWYILQTIYVSPTQIILCDTIGTNHKLFLEIDSYNNKLSIINNTTNTFTTDFLIPNKIIPFQCTGKKIIFFSKELNKFVGHYTEQLFILDCLSYDVIKSNSIPTNYNFDNSASGRTSIYESKYIKYKNKYLKLKSLQPNN